MLLQNTCCVLCMHRRLFYHTQARLEHFILNQWNLSIAVTHGTSISSIASIHHSTLQYTPHAVTVHTYNGGTSATHALSTRSLVGLQVMVAEATWMWEAEGSEQDPLTLGATRLLLMISELRTASGLYNTNTGLLERDQRGAFDLL